MTKKKSPKMGRPKAPAGQARTVVLQFRISETESIGIDQAAAKAGKTGPVWARDIVLAASKPS